MSILHRIFGINRETPVEHSFVDPELQTRAVETTAKINEVRTELRQKVQRTQSASRVMGTMSGMMHIMKEAERGTDSR